MLSVCSKHLPQESKFQQKLAEMSEYFIFSLTAQQWVPCIKQFVPTRIKTVLNVDTSLVNLLSCFVPAPFNLENPDYKMQSSSKAFLRLSNGTAA